MNILFRLYNGGTDLQRVAIDLHGPESFELDCFAVEVTRDRIQVHMKYGESPYYTKHDEFVMEFFWQKYDLFNGTEVDMIFHENVYYNNFSVTMKENQ
jgi:hypothetical protein